MVEAVVVVVAAVVVVAVVDVVEVLVDELVVDVLVSAALVLVVVVGSAAVLVEVDVESPTILPTSGRLDAVRRSPSTALEMPCVTVVELVGTKMSVPTDTAPTKAPAPGTHKLSLIHI